MNVNDFSKELIENKKKIKLEGELSLEQQNKLAVEFVKNSKCKTVEAKYAKKKSTK